MLIYFYDDLFQFTTLISKISTDLAALAQLIGKGSLGDLISSAGSGAHPPKKAKRDPNAPKPNLTSYIHFSREYRPKVEKENPKLTPNEVVSHVAKKWNSLSDSQKQVSFALPDIYIYAKYLFFFYYMNRNIRISLLMIKSVLIKKWKHITKS